MNESFITLTLLSAVVLLICQIDLCNAGMFTTLTFFIFFLCVVDFSNEMVKQTGLSLKLRLCYE